MTDGKFSFGGTEKRYNKKEQQYTCNNDHPGGERHYFSQVIKKTGIDETQQDRRNNYSSITFFVDLHNTA
jgi:hypothetical protein